MHALGFYHEQARPDAKKHIKVQEFVKKKVDLEDVQTLFVIIEIKINLFCQYRNKNRFNPRSSNLNTYIIFYFNLFEN